MADTTLAYEIMNVMCIAVDSRIRGRSPSMLDDRVVSSDMNWEALQIPICTSLLFRKHICQPFKRSLMALHGPCTLKTLSLSMGFLEDDIKEKACRVSMERMVSS